MCSVPPGSQNTAQTHRGSPGTWDALYSPRLTSGRGPGLPTPGPTGCALDRRERNTGAGRGIAKRTQRSDARWRQGIGALHSTDEVGEPNPREPGGGSAAKLTAKASGWKSRRRKSPCGAVVISGSLQGDLKPGSPDVQALDGPAGTEPPWSGQHRGRATERAAAKANGLTVEIRVPHEADSSGVLECQDYLSSSRWPLSVR